MSEIPIYVTKEKLLNFFNLALLEDIGSGDHTTRACISEDDISEFKLIAKDDGILAGVYLSDILFKFYDPSIKLNILKTDGQYINKGDCIYEIKGRSRSILTCERIILNCLQRMSGIASMTRNITSLLFNNVKILDTRKTTPNFRMLEKWAVYIGGGNNHRFGLYDMILIKDNHIDICGSITKAILLCKNYILKNNLNLKIEVEVRNLEELKSILDYDIDIVMLDNFNYKDIEKSINIINKKFLVEVSGNISINNIKDLCSLNIDFISMGALTHSANNFDMSLVIK